MSERPTVVQTEDLDPRAAAWLGERCRLVTCGLDRLAGVNGEFEDARGLVVRTYTRVDRGLLDHFPGLKVVGRAGVGLENIDVDECRSRGIEVVHTPEANSSAVAEYVFTMLLDATRPRKYIREPVDFATWGALRRDLRADRQIGELTIGVLGMGKVGSRVARAADGFGARVWFHDLAFIPHERRHGATESTLDEMRRCCDVITIHVDARPENQGLIGREWLSRLKKDVILINTSRGQVIDPEAMAEFLTDHPGASALLDVHVQEPFDDRYPLLRCPNARLSPHLAAATRLANERMSWVVEDVWRVLCGQSPMHAAESRK